MAIKSVRDLDLKGKRVFVRCDFNVPVDDSGAIKDDTRIRRSLPTIRYVVEQGGRCILASHLGRPKGERKPEMTLRPVAVRLGELLGREVGFVGDCVGDQAEKAVALLQDGDVLVLENLRFHSGETKNAPEFSAQLATLADVYVNDAFGTAHRAHASTTGIVALVKEKAAGLLMKEELDTLAKALSNPDRPLVGIFGGAKVSDKIEVLRNIVQSMDAVLIGGGMANTFLESQGMSMGNSRIEDNMLETAWEILEKARTVGCSVLLPVDVVVSDRIAEGAGGEAVSVKAVPPEEMALDVGPATVEAFRVEIAKAGTIVWNGPMGVFEIEDFRKGTMEIAQAVASSRGYSLIGGGDTIRAVREAGVSDKISYISTGGGAFMEFMEGKTLPGVAALEQ